MPSDEEEALPKRKKPITQPKSKRQKLETDENQLIKKAIDCMNKATANENKEDAFDIFGRYVASELRSIPSLHAQRWVKLQIQNIMYNAQTEPSVQPRGSVYSMPYSPPANFSGSSVSPSPSLPDWSSHHSYSDQSSPSNYTNNTANYN